MAILTVSVILITQWQHRDFYIALPTSTQQERDALGGTGKRDDSPAIEIYGQYRYGDVLFDQKWALLAGLLVCLPFGLATGFWVSRFVTLPLASVTEAARRIALGDFSVRAQSGADKGELADMVRDFNHMTDSLEKLERERKATAAAVSHELRTPLTVLRGRLHAICDGVIPPSETEFNTLLKQVEHLGRLVDDLHTLSVADAGRLSLQMTEFDFIPFLKELTANYGDRLAARGIALELHVQAAQAWVHADPNSMRHAISNLLEYALQRSRESTWLGISIRLDAHFDRVILTISDAGPSMSHDAHRSLFQRFHHPDGSHPNTGEGSGLSLPVALALVVRQGGELEADRSERGGTRFTICIPSSELARE
ncbi:Signal transduction histidine-protein kinase BaeS [Variovorax boronicumulans]|uniref:ATP-binding protein n=1 Tax=Variovorax boronicumulans TaxID=436515 RepID=UPI000FB7E54B|nr:ATP-binding protein [Variovorax boronicumulans]PBI89311.1 Signal transduction histidine-protein kinase BaeS [Variovorax boronicumulans]